MYCMLHLSMYKVHDTIIEQRNSTAAALTLMDDSILGSKMETSFKAFKI